MLAAKPSAVMQGALLLRVHHWLALGTGRRRLRGVSYIIQLGANSARWKWHHLFSGCQNTNAFEFLHRLDSPSLQLIYKAKRTSSSVVKHCIWPAKASEDKAEIHKE